MKKTALITGINGQDGSYLADFLLDKGYTIYGMERRCSTKIRLNTKHLEGKIRFINGDLADQNSLFRCIKECGPDEIYNLGAMSFVGESWNTPETTGNIDALGVLRMLEVIREYGKRITENHMGFLLVVEFYLITNQNVAALNLLLEK